MANKIVVNIITGEIISGEIINHPFANKAELYKEVVRCRDGVLRAVDEVDSTNRWDPKRKESIEILAKEYRNNQHLPPLEEIPASQFKHYQEMIIELAFKAGHEARRLQEKQEFSDAYSHGSPVQQIAKEYVSRRGTDGNLALYEENRFIDGYMFALKQLELKHS